MDSYAKVGNIEDEADIEFNARFSFHVGFSDLPSDAPERGVMTSHRPMVNLVNRR
jgi:hypothetical protein